MSAYFEQNDIKQYVSTYPETGYGVEVPKANMNREFKLADTEVGDTQKITPYNHCGGEFYSVATVEQKDANHNLNFLACPDKVGWWNYYMYGGGAGYAPTGVVDPYLHTSKLIKAPDYEPDSFTVYERYEGSDDIAAWRGGVMGSGRFGGTMDGDKRIRIQSTAEFAGEQTAVVDYTEPTCVPEEIYRMPDVTMTLSALTINAAGAVTASTPITGLVLRNFEFEFNQKLEGVDQAERSGLYLASRARGDRSDSFLFRCAVLGKRGDAVDLAFRNNTFLAVTIAIANKTANRVWTTYMPKGQIMRRGRGYSSGVGKTTHEIELLGFRDETSALTLANTPVYSTVQTATPTYAATV